MDSSWYYLPTKLRMDTSRHLPANVHSPQSRLSVVFLRNGLDLTLNCHVNMLA